ncbi:MAG: hypothetical protein QXW39_04570 [Candidatus Bathyarchaeia archaeon]
MRVLCPKCGLIGYLVRKKTVSRGYSYNYWYVEHKWGGGVKWCYIGRLDGGERIYKLYTQTVYTNFLEKPEKGISVSLLLPKAPPKMPSIPIHKMCGK